MLHFFPFFFLFVLLLLLLVLVVALLLANFVFSVVCFPLVPCFCFFVAVAVEEVAAAVSVGFAVAAGMERGMEVLGESWLSACIQFWLPIVPNGEHPISSFILCCSWTLWIIFFSTSSENILQLESKNSPMLSFVPGIGGRCVHPPPSANGTGVMLTPLLLLLLLMLLAEFPAGVAVADDDAEDGDPKDDPKKDEKLNCPGLLLLLLLLLLLISCASLAAVVVSGTAFFCGLFILSSDPFL